MTSSGSIGYLKRRQIRNRGVSVLLKVYDDDAYVALSGMPKEQFVRASMSLISKHSVSLSDINPTSCLLHISRQVQFNGSSITRII